MTAASATAGSFFSSSAATASVRWLSTEATAMGSGLPPSTPEARRSRTARRHLAGAAATRAPNSAPRPLPLDIAASFVAALAGDIPESNAAASSSFIPPSAAANTNTSAKNGGCITPRAATASTSDVVAALSAMPTATRPAPLKMVLVYSTSLVAAFLIAHEMAEATAS